MRNDFVKQIHKEMELDKSIVFLTGDLGFNALEGLMKDFPNRFYNVGIAEQNMAGMAAGLALSGHKVIIYSIASFVTMRCYEQIRTDICYHNLDVKIIGAGGGYNYSDNGITHHTIEDIALMSALPNMKVFCPSHSWEATGATREMVRDKGPAYIRLGISPHIDYQKPDWVFKAGKSYILKPGKDIALFFTGNITDTVFGVAELLEKNHKLSTEIISLPTIKPLDKKIILDKSLKTKGIFTVEEHSVIGGLGSMVGALLAKANYNFPFHHFGIKDEFVKEVGNWKYLREVAGLGPKNISKEINKIIKNHKF